MPRFKSKSKIIGRQKKIESNRQKTIRFVVSTIVTKRNKEKKWNIAKTMCVLAKMEQKNRW